LDHPIAASNTPATAYLGGAYGVNELAVEKAEDWFSGCPIPICYSPLEPSDPLPAITHLDGSSRLQVVNESCGGLRRIFENSAASPVFQSS
jgi:predicted NodU family carbamoyl transferase